MVVWYFWTINSSFIPCRKTTEILMIMTFNRASICSNMIKHLWNSWLRNIWKWWLRLETWVATFMTSWGFFSLSEAPTAGDLEGVGEVPIRRSYIAWITDVTFTLNYFKMRYPVISTFPELNSSPLEKRQSQKEKTSSNHHVSEASW